MTKPTGSRTKDTRLDRVSHPMADQSRPGREPRERRDDDGADRCAVVPPARGLGPDDGAAGSIDSPASCAATRAR